MFDDEKIKIIRKLPEGDTLLLIWIQVLCLAGKANFGGYLMLDKNIPYDEELLESVFDRPRMLIRMALNTFERFGMLAINQGCYCIANWEKNQNADAMDLIRIQTNERVKKFRQRQKELLELPPPEKDCNVTCNVTDNVTATHGNGIEVEVEVEVEVDKKESKPLVPKKQGTTCPVDEIALLWIKLVPNNPHPRMALGKLKSKELQTAIKARWKEEAERRDLAWWEDFFRYVSRGDHLVGKSKGREWFADLQWITKPANMEKVLQGNYNNGHPFKRSDGAYLAPEKKVTKYV